MTRAVIDPGICGMHTTVEINKVAQRKVKVVISSDCEMVTKLGESLAKLDIYEAFKQHVDCTVYKDASSCQLHTTCPVPMAILKAIEVEAGLALPCDVIIRFDTTVHD